MKRSILLVADAKAKPCLPLVLFVPGTISSEYQAREKRKNPTNNSISDRQDFMEVRGRDTEKMAIGSEIKSDLLLFCRVVSVEVPTRRSAQIAVPPKTPDAHQVPPQLPNMAFSVARVLNFLVVFFMPMRNTGFYWF